MKLLYPYFHSVYLFMHKFGTRFGEEFTMPIFIALTFLFPVNLFLNFLISAPEMGRLIAIEIMLVFTIGVILSFIPFTVRVLRKYFKEKSKSEQTKYNAWNILAYSLVILITLTHPIIIMLIRLKLEHP